MNFLLTGLKQINNWKIIEIKNYCNQLSNHLKNKLIRFGIKFENEKYFNPHLFAIGLPEKISPEFMKKKLEEKMIYVSLRGNEIRISLNVYNNIHDINKFISAIKSSLDISKI